MAWHQTGTTCIRVRDSWKRQRTPTVNRFAIVVQLGDTAGQALTLLQLGNLYAVDFGRSEEAATFFRQAADKCVEIADPAKRRRERRTISQKRCGGLGRFEEARQEIRRAIECNPPVGHASQPWKTWAILADIETDANPTGATKAKRKAIECYLAYRRDDGENHNPEAASASP